MDNNIETLYKELFENLNEEEKEHSKYLIYTPNGFVQYKECYKKDTLSLNIRIKENRKQDILNILKDLNVNYKITNENNYYIVFEIIKEKNYIVCDFVVNSHITIPQSFLKHFARKSQDRALVVDYININTMTIEEEKVKDYGAEYGYYSKFIEKYLSDNFECKIANITKDLNNFRNKKVDNVNFTKEIIEDIYNFFDITSYRNPNMLRKFNEKSLSSKLIGGYTHDNMLELVANRKFPHIFEGLKFNIIINKTDRDFVINDTMISSIFCDKKNEVVILPINKKECIALMSEEYYKKYIVDNKLYFMNIEDYESVEMINRYIFRYAKRNKENIIGTKKELQVLLEKEN